MLFRSSVGTVLLIASIITNELQMDEVERSALYFTYLQFVGPWILLPAMTSVKDAETKYYHHGRFALTGGALPDAITAYRTYGDPTNPCIVFPTCYGGRLDSKQFY